MRSSWSEASAMTSPDEHGTFRSGFVTIVGRPNVGKSTLVNRLVGDKVTIVSSKPNTTRFQIRGIVSRPEAQVILVDTPGLHKPKTTLGGRLNDSALAALADVDVVVAIIEAGSAIGPGDTVVIERALDAVAGRTRSTLMVVVNKIDKSGPDHVAQQLLAASNKVDELLRSSGRTARVDYFPLSARTGKGAEELLRHIIKALPEGPAYYPTDVTTDSPEAIQLAELVREQLLGKTHDELPHSIACRVTEWEWPRVKVEILVERDSQKGIVIGKGGAVLHDVGVAVREAFAAEMYLELFVKVEKHWQRRDDALDRLHERLFELGRHAAPELDHPFAAFDFCEGSQQLLHGAHALILHQPWWRRDRCSGWLGIARGADSSGDPLGRAR